MLFKRTFLKLLAIAGLFLSFQVQAYLLPCQLVTQMAGSEVYEAKLQRVASMTAPEDLPAAMGLELLERHGGWYIYQTPEPWFERRTCGPQLRTVQGKNLQFMPVLLNKKTGRNAVLTGTFLLKTYRSKHLDEVIERYGFRLVTRLPKPDTVIIDVKPIQSYDDMIEMLDKDRDVELVAPLMSEPRYQLR